MVRRPVAVVGESSTSRAAYLGHAPGNVECAPKVQMVLAQSARLADLQARPRQGQN
ncbi:MAG: hypothetical protein ACYCS2_05430 [Acidimicrobiales bacterium]